TVEKLASSVPRVRLPTPASPERQDPSYSPAAVRRSVPRDWNTLLLQIHHRPTSLRVHTICIPWFLSFLSQITGAVEAAPRDRDPRAQTPNPCPVEERFQLPIAHEARILTDHPSSEREPRCPLVPIAR